jgi:hypothetical protein
MNRSETDTVNPNIINNRTTNAKGKLKVFNTINEFNMLDKNKLLEQLGQDVNIFFVTLLSFLIDYY